MLSAVLKTGVVKRGKIVSAAPNADCCGTRLLNVPSTVLRPKGTCTFGSSVRRFSPAACLSAMMICWRMNSRSDRMNDAMAASFAEFVDLLQMQFHVLRMQLRFSLPPPTGPGRSHYISAILLQYFCNTCGDVWHSARNGTNAITARAFCLRAPVCPEKEMRAYVAATS